MLKPRKEYPKGLPTLGQLIGGMLPAVPDKQKEETATILAIAAEACLRCGGFPPGCTCIEEALISPAWIDWPNEIVYMLPELIREFQLR